jgi:hypothetical protein
MEANGAGAAAAGADEETPTAAVGETDVLERHGEGDFGEGDGSGRIVGAVRPAARRREALT